MELLEYGEYLEAGGQISPLSILNEQGTNIDVQSTAMVIKDDKLTNVWL